MKYLITILLGFCLIQFSILHLDGNEAFAKEPAKSQAGSSQLQDRIDFGNSYIVGQTIKSGAVYLLKRKKSDIKSMLRTRESYRQEILEDFHIEDMKVKE